MPTYAIGDVQGCFDALQRLLDRIQFDPVSDTLWLTGDLVNRGPDSLKTLRFIKSLAASHQTVLGNHDLHFLAVALGAQAPRAKDTFNDLLNASDRDELIDWLIKQPLLYAKNDYVLVHAGLAPTWTLSQAKSLAREVEAILQSEKATSFFVEMYGDQPNQWSDDLVGMDRIRCIVNYFTRMRFCDPSGRLNLQYKGTLNDKPAELVPWFDMPDRPTHTTKIIFGHWAALNGVTNQANCYALDTGCVWGNCLTAMQLETGERIAVSCGR